MYTKLKKLIFLKNGHIWYGFYNIILWKMQKHVVVIEPVTAGSIKEGIKGEWRIMRQNIEF